MSPDQGLQSVSGQNPVPFSPTGEPVSAALSEHSAIGKIQLSPALHLGWCYWHSDISGQNTGTRGKMEKLKSVTESRQCLIFPLRK